MSWLHFLLPMAAQALCKSSMAASCSWSTRWALIICHLGIVAAWLCTNLLGLPTPHAHICPDAASSQSSHLHLYLHFPHCDETFKTEKQCLVCPGGSGVQGYRMSPLPRLCVGLYWIFLSVLGRVCAEAATHLLTGCPLQQAQYVLVKVLTWQNCLVCITDTLLHCGHTAVHSYHTSVLWCSKPSVTV